MDKKKLPNTIDDRELIDIVESVKDDPSVTVEIERPLEHTVFTFLADYSIYPGNIRVDRTLLYKIYRLHYGSKVSTIKNQTFFSLLDNYLKYEVVSNKVYYLLNQENAKLVKIYADFLAKKEYNKKITSRHYRKHIETFLNRFNIKKGTSNISASVLYYFYDKWAYNESKSRTRLNFVDFNGLVNLYLERKRTRYVWRIFKIDKSFFNQFTEEEIKIATDWAEKFNGNKERRYDFGKKNKNTRKKEQKIKN